MGYFKNASFLDKYKIVERSHNSPVISFINNYRINTNNVCEIGFGNGNLLKKIKKKFNSEIFGVDIDQNAINHMNNFINKSSNFKSKFSFTKMFDLIIMVHCLEHFEKNDAQNLLKECVQNLKTDGNIVIIIPINEIIPFSEHKILFTSGNSLEFINNLNLFNITKYYENCGLKNFIYSKLFFPDIIYNLFTFLPNTIFNLVDSFFKKSRGQANILLSKK